MSTENMTATEIDAMDSPVTDYSERLEQDDARRWAKHLDTESEFQSWAIVGFGYVVYVDQVFAKFDPADDGDYRIMVRGEGDDEGTWTQWS